MWNSRAILDDIRDHGPEEWKIYKCRCCSAEVIGSRPRMCPNCLEASIEALVHRLDPTYDSTAMNDWERANSVLKNLYGDSTIKGW